MTVTLLVSANGELADVAVHRAFGELEPDVAAACPALFRLDQRQVDRVGNKVGLHQKTLLLALIGKVVRLAREAAFEIMLGVEQKVGVFVDVHQRRHVGHRDKTRRLRARAVKMLMMGIERDAKNGSGAPLEAGLGATVIPHGGRPTTRQHQDGFLEQLAMRVQLAARRDLHDIAVIGRARGVVVDEDRVAATARPGLHVDLVKARHINTVDDIQALTGDEARIRRFPSRT